MEKLITLIESSEKAASALIALADHLKTDSPITALREFSGRSDSWGIPMDALI